MKTIMEVHEIITTYKKTGTIKGTAKKLGISKNTVKKYLKSLEEAKSGNREKIVEYKRSNKHIQKREALKNEIAKILEKNKKYPQKQRITAKKIYRKLVVEEKKFEVSYSTIKKIVREWKNENEPRKVYIKQDNTLKDEAEFDIGYIWLKINGKEKKYPCMYFVMGKSLYRYAEIYTGESQLEIIESHKHFFNEIGGIPSEIVYDNLKAVVTDWKKKKYNERFVEFATYYEFKIRNCNIMSPQEKGTDEESVGYIRREIFSDRIEFDTLEEANEYLKKGLNRINSLKVARREKIPYEGLKDEVLHRIPSLEWENALIESRKINGYSMISIDGNKYSVPDDYYKNIVKVKIYVDKIQIYDISLNKLLAEFKRSHEKGKEYIDITHYIKTLKKKPGALKRSKALQTAQKTLQTLYNNYYTTEVKGFTKILELVKEYGINRVVKKIEETFEMGIKPTHDILKNLLQQKSEINYEQFKYTKEITINYGEPEEFDALVFGDKYVG